MEESNGRGEVEDKLVSSRTAENLRKWPVQVPEKSLCKGKDRQAGSNEQRP